MWIHKIADHLALHCIAICVPHPTSTVQGDNGQPFARWATPHYNGLWFSMRETCGRNVKETGRCLRGWTPMSRRWQTAPGSVSTLCTPPCSNSCVKQWGGVIAAGGMPARPSQFNAWMQGKRSCTEPRILEPGCYLINCTPAQFLRKAALHFILVQCDNIHFSRWKRERANASWMIDKARPGYWSVAMSPAWFFWLLDKDRIYMQFNSMEKVKKEWVSFSRRMQAWWAMADKLSVTRPAFNQLHHLTG